MNKLVGLLLVCFTCTAHGSVILDFDLDGLLAGAKGVPVSGELYNVRFVDGTCAEVYPGCAGFPLEFAFQNDVFKALDATIALETYVFIDDYLLDPALTVGCIGLGFQARDYCDVETPYRDSSGLGRGYGSVFLRLAPTVDPNSDGDRYYGKTSSTTLDSTGRPNVWAVWTRQPAEVAEPGMLWLFAASLLVLGRAQIRRRCL